MLTLEQIKNKATDRLEGLHPIVASAAIALIERSYQKGVPIVITQGLRTIEYQNGLYCQGRTKPGKIVTNARGGYSFHNFGLAIDFALLMPDGRAVSWDTYRDGDNDGDRDWLEVAKIGKELGFEWGGDWNKFLDMPHFQMTFGLTTADLRAGKQPQIKKVEAMPKMNKEDALAVIQSLQKLWGMEKDKGKKAEIHRQANAVRKAAGISLQ